jgi:diguanylate cyclase (GGDEF)-like protein/PAS domain S-box-containing protein
MDDPVRLGSPVVVPRQVTGSGYRETEATTQPTAGESADALLPGQSRSRSPGGAVHEVEDGQLLASIAAALDECVICTALDGTILWASAATEAVLGWRADELVGSHAAKLVPGGLTDPQAAYVERLRAGEAIEPLVKVGTKRDGTTFEAVVRLGAVSDPTGRLVGVTAILRDVTDEPRTHLELERVVELSRAWFEQVRTPQALTDLQGHLTAVSPAWCELFGHSEELLVGRDVMSLVHPMDVGNAAEQLAPLRRGEAESASYEAVFRGARGQNLTLLLDATLLRGPQGAPLAVAVVARDLSEVKEARGRLAATEGLYRALGRQSWYATIVTDAELNNVHVSPSVAEMLGYEPEEILQLDGLELLHPEDAAAARQVVDRVISEPHRTERFVARFRHKMGHWRWVEESLTNCLMDPDIGGLVASLHDITEQVETQQALRLSEARYRAIVETAQEGIVATGTDGMTLFANDKLAHILGLSLHDLYQADARALLRCDTGVEASGASVQDEDGPVSYETTYAHPDGDERILSVACSRPEIDGHDTSLGTLWMVSDVTAARQAETTLRHQALHDPLTGLPNRYLLLDRLDMADARQRRADAPSTAVLFLDLDGFKSVNDRLGHEAGDELLVELASRLTSAVRATDTVGRLGGDEFAVICEDTSAEGAMLVASRLHDALLEPIVVMQDPLQVSASIGIAMCPPNDFSDLLRLADAAMYTAKELGGGRTALHRHEDWRTHQVGRPEST